MSCDTVREPLDIQDGHLGGGRGLSLDPGNHGLNRGSLRTDKMTHFGPSENHL